MNVTNELVLVLAFRRGKRSVWHWITIDGPAATGKSTLGQTIANQLGWLCIDTGLFYRTVAWLAAREQIAPSNAAACATLVLTIDVQQPLAQSPRSAPLRLLVHGEEVSRHVQTPILPPSTALIASHAQVRRALLVRFRALTTQASGIMIGRDAGTMILPAADLKVILSASLEQRAWRRWNQLCHSAPEGIPPVPLGHIQEELARRDVHDPFFSRPATDALVLDTDTLHHEEVTRLVLALLVNHGFATHQEAGI